MLHHHGAPAIEPVVEDRLWRLLATETGLASPPPELGVTPYDVLIIASLIEERAELSVAVITNDIYTREDADFLLRHEALEDERIMGVETGGCPHTAIREDASMNLAAVEDLQKRFPGLEVVFIESGGDNLSATFSPELADLTIYVIDVSEGEKIPRKGGPGITRSDLLVINKISGASGPL